MGIRQQRQGFSLLEMAVVLLLLSIVAAFCIPNFSQTFQQQHYRQLQAQLQRSLNFARIEAISLNQTIQVTANNPSNWCDGWQVASDGLVIKAFPAVAGCQLRWRAFPDSDALEFLPEGQTRYQNGRFTLTVADVQRWTLLVSQSGRVRRG